MMEKGGVRRCGGGVVGGGEGTVRRGMQGGDCGKRNHVTGMRWPVCV